MPLLHIAILALFQGVTEFLPISSSAHLVLVPKFLCWQDQGLTIDVAVHVGTLGAIVLYLWRDLWDMTVAVLQVAKGRRNPNARMAGFIVLATVPVIAAGLAVDHYFPNGIRNLTVIAWATLGFGVLLWLTDKTGMTVRRMEHFRLSDAMIIGFAQVLALIPGTSRSGITMTAARMLGVERLDSARFSMLLSIPTIVGAGVLKGWDLYKSGNSTLTHEAFTAAGLSFGAAFVAVILMMAWLRRATFTPFVLYRVALGLFLLTVAYGWVDWNSLLGIVLDCAK